MVYQHQLFLYSWIVPCQRAGLSYFKFLSNVELINELMSRKDKFVNLNFQSTTRKEINVCNIKIIETCCIMFNLLVTERASWHLTACRWHKECCKTSLEVVITVATCKSRFSISSIGICRRRCSEQQLTFGKSRIYGKKSCAECGTRNNKLRN